MSQVRPEHYRTDEYNSVERFCSYAHQLKLIAGLDVQSILEVGPGTFLVSDALKRRGYSVTTCDFDPELGADATGDVRNLPFQDNSFDLVMACQVLEHLPFETIDQALRELARVSRLHVLISVPFRQTGFAATIRLPLMQSILKRTLLEVFFYVPTIFPGFARSGQHYWELDLFRTPVSHFRRAANKRGLGIASETRPALNKYHYFFLLRKQDAFPSI